MDIPDEYPYMDPELAAMIRSGTEPLIEGLLNPLGQAHRADKL
jgi:hypothetical protein